MATISSLRTTPMRDTPIPRTTRQTDQIPTWSSRLNAIGCVLMLIAGIAWASPTVRHGIDLIRSSKEIKAPLIETAVTRIAARPLAAKPPVETERQGTLRFLEFSETPDLKTSDGAGRVVGFSLRKDNPHPNPEIANSKTARSTSGAIASRLFQELRYQVELGLRRLGRVAFSSTLP